MTDVSYGSGIDMDTTYRTSYETTMTNSVQRRSCGSLNELVDALKEEITAGAESLVPGCTTSELSLDASAILPLQRPSVGPYADGGTHDLPNDFKVSWTIISDARKPHPRATVENILSAGDARTRNIVQRAASRGIVAAIERADGFKYSFNNAWGAKDEDGQRFSYVCQDSMQNKDRHANGFTRTQKNLKGDGERGARKPTYDCKGSISVKISSSRSCIDVYYRHYAIHGTVSERKRNPLPAPRMSNTIVPDSTHRNEQNGNSGGLLRKLQAEASAYEPPPSTQAVLAIIRHEASNVGRPLKRKRDYDAPVPQQNADKNLSLVDLLKQSQANEPAAAPSSVTPKTTATKYPPPMTYELPSWLPRPEEKPPPAPISNPRHPAPLNVHTQAAQSGPQFTAPYPTPYRSYQPQQPPQFPQPIQFQQPPTRPQLPPVPQTQPVPPKQQEVFGAPKQSSPKGQGLFTTMKPVAQDPPLLSYRADIAYQCRFNCRYTKKKCDNQRPICGSCRLARRYDCAYDERYSHSSASAWPYQPAAPTANMAPIPPQYK